MIWLPFKTLLKNERLPDDPSGKTRKIIIIVADFIGDAWSNLFCDISYKKTDGKSGKSVTNEVTFAAVFMRICWVCRQGFISSKLFTQDDHIVWIEITQKMQLR